MTTAERKSIDEELTTIKEVLKQAFSEIGYDTHRWSATSKYQRVITDLADYVGSKDLLEILYHHGICKEFDYESDN